MQKVVEVVGPVEAEELVPAGVALVEGELAVVRVPVEAALVPELGPVVELVQDRAEAVLAQAPEQAPAREQVPEQEARAQVPEQEARAQGPVVAAGTPTRSILR